MHKLMANPRIVLPIIGVIGLLLYVTAPCWLSNVLVSRLDFVALGFAGIITLPWLVSCFEEFQFSGFKAKFRSVEERTDEAAATAHGTRELVEELAISRSATQGTQDARKSPPMPAPSSATDEDLAGAIQDLRKLSRQYVAIRGSMPSGPERTVRMTEIFGQLEAAAKKIPAAQGNIVGWLSDEDAGYQIAAIAWLRSHPENIRPAKLIDTIEHSSQPFVQYWALRVLHGHVDREGINNFRPVDLGRLQQLEKQMRQKTDRWYQLKSINRKLRDGY